MNSVGIIGLGSIGRRHARILKSLNGDLSICSYRTNKGSLQDAVEHVAELGKESFFSSKFDLIVISNPSSFHLHTLREVLHAGLAKTIVVEKPFCLPGEATAARQLIAESARTRILPGNCLRFHPAISLLKAAIAGGELGRVLECHAHFGTYMPGWHPYEDYRSAYAAKRELGGGVLLTSIHEIDLVHHLFGKGKVAGAYSGSVLLNEIDVEDTAHILLTLERCKVANLSLNFFERPADRFLKVIFSNGTFFWRFGEPGIRVTRWHKDRMEEESISVDASVDSMYINMWKCVLENQLADFELPSVFESLDTAATAGATGETLAWN